MNKEERDQVMVEISDLGLRLAALLARVDGTPPVALDYEYSLSFKAKDYGQGAVSLQDIKLVPIQHPFKKSEFKVDLQAEELHEWTQVRRGEE